MQPLKIPYGIADFQTLMTESYFYQDRTDRIPLIEQAGKQLLFLRPRRFGKSLLLSMLENYYDVNKTEQFHALFGHLAIGQNPTALHNRYFVLKWDFSTIAAHGSVADIEQRIHEHINDRIASFIFYYEARLKHPVLINKENALSSLSSVLTAINQTDHKLYLLIDEYDNFANDVMIAGKAHYQDLLQGEGLLKTVFKNIKAGAAGLGLDRVFITGVSPVVMSDMTSGYNVATNIYLEPEFNELCGFTSDEISALLTQVLPEDSTHATALELMRTFYNGYRFSPYAESSVYNPTLSLYFIRAVQKNHRYPDNLLDENLAMDRNKLRYIDQLAQGRELLIQALSHDNGIQINHLSERFGVEDMLNAVKDQAFMGSLLYYFGILTLTGISGFGEYILNIPNLVARQLYVERLRDDFLTDYNARQMTQTAAKIYCQSADLHPLCDFIEQHYFKLFSNRDYRWVNELMLKIIFMTLVYNDHIYMMVSELETGRRYVDLSLIVRPDKRQYHALDLVLEFKLVKLSELNLSAEQVKTLSVQQIKALPIVAKQLSTALKQAQEYMQELQSQYPKATLHGSAVVAIGFERIVFESVQFRKAETVPV